MPSKLSHLLTTAILFIIKALLFLTPVFFIPVTFEYFEFNKQMLLWLGTGAALVLWGTRSIVVDKRLVYKRTPLDVPIAIVIAVWGLATAVSVDPYASWFGTYGRFADAFLGTASLAALYFLIVQTVEREHVPGLLRWFTGGATLALAAGMAALSGLTRLLPESLPGAPLLRSAGFNPSGGSPEAFALFAATLLVAVTAWYAYRIQGTAKTRGQMFMYAVTGGLALAAVAAINYGAAWLTVLVGAGLVFGFSLFVSYAYREHGRIDIAPGAPLGVVLFSIVMMVAFGGAGSLLPRDLPQEVIVPPATDWSVARNALFSRPVLGYGPGGYDVAFSAGRPAAFNNDRLWQVRFDKGSSYWLELVSTVGILGVLAYAVLAGFVLFMSFVFIRNIFRAANEDSYVAFGFSFLALSALVTQFLYPSNTVLLFTFWIGLAVAMTNWRFAFAQVFVTHEWDIRSRREAVSIAYALVVAAAGVYVAGAVAVGRQYIADLHYNGYRLTGDQEQLAGARAANGRRMHYHTAAARAAVASVRDDIEVLSTAGGAERIPAERRDEIRAVIEAAARAAEAATVTAPRAVAAWEQHGALYRDIRYIAVGSLEPAIRSFERAHELEPTNPVLLTELGKLYLDREQTGEAVSAFERAIALKPDYLDAHRGLASAYDKLGQPDKALVVLEEVIRTRKNPELLYEAGRLYYNQGRLEEAIARFEAALALRPAYANALYSLGLAYRKQGNTAAALEQFEAVLALNPENAAVRELVEELEQ